MDSKLFRKESLERFSSPEALHDYLRVTSPRMWMVLTAVLLLTAGFVFYASSATMEETLPVQVRITASGEGESGGGASAEGVREQKQWLEAIINDTEPLVKPEQASVVTQILEAIYKSAETGKEVYFD